MPPSYKPTRILVHHSAAQAPVPQFAAINEWHKAREFPISALGFHVGYHIVIEKDGTVVRARNDEERDCDAFGHNFDSLSVCLVGNFSQSNPKNAQVTALGKVLSEWCLKYGFGASDIKPHRAVGNTTCYGSMLADNWAALVFLRYEVSRIQKLIDAMEGRAK